MPRTAPKLGGGSLELDPAAFEARFNMPLVHETVRAELNARRQGTASTKTRGQVRGGGALGQGSGDLRRHVRQRGRWSAPPTKTLRFRA